jgi:hypothetical protein
MRHKNKILRLAADTKFKLPDGPPNKLSTFCYGNNRIAVRETFRNALEHDFGVAIVPGIG